MDGQWQIDTADNCLRAGTKLAQLKPDLVILRLPMAGMDPQTCRQIRQTSAGARCKLLVILTTGNIGTAQHIGAEGCLSKDFTADELRAKVMALLTFQTGQSLLMHGKVQVSHCQQTGIQSVILLRQAVMA